MKFTKGPATSSPSSSIGIMRFFDADTPAPKLSPELVVGFSLIIIVIVLVIKNIM